MDATKKNYLQAVRALESAYRADRQAYDDLPRQSKAFWALQPLQSWPRACDFTPWRQARLALLAAERDLYEALRERCAAIVWRRVARQVSRQLECAPYVEQLVDTVPGALHPAGFSSTVRPRRNPASPRLLH